jgi:hypothetical protein
MFKQLKAGLSNALVWGAAWFGGSVLLLGAFVLLGLAPTFPPLGGLIRIAMRFGLTGLVAGAGFSAFLTYVYQGEKLTGIKSTPFILGGALVSAVLSPFLGGTALIGALLGGGTAAVTLAAARRADRGRLMGGDVHELLPPGTDAESPTQGEQA